MKKSGIKNHLRKFIILTVVFGISLTAFSLTNTTSSKAPLKASYDTYESTIETGEAYALSPDAKTTVKKLQHHDC